MTHGLLSSGSRHRPVLSYRTVFHQPSQEWRGNKGVCEEARRPCPLAQPCLTRTLFGGSVAWRRLQILQRDIHTHWTGRRPDVSAQRVDDTVAGKANRNEDKQEPEQAGHWKPGNFDP
jgi:hypothetical protein